jgi:hypothetical protein
MTEEILQGPVAENVQHAISNIRDEQGNLAAGNVVRRACEWLGEGACKEGCALRLLQEKHLKATDIGRGLETEAAIDRTCADLNLETTFYELGLEPEEILMVGVTGDKVGFMDSLDDYEGLTENARGWHELPGFNAFFAREGEVEGLGRRLADCADINFEFKDSDGHTVLGFEHGTRPNMFGSSKYRFEGPDGTKISYTEYVMRQAIEHYGAEPTSMRINLAAAIQRSNNADFSFKDLELMQKVLPGWYEDGFSRNLTNPDWRPGDPINPEDKWDADTRGLIIRDIEKAMAAIGVPVQNFDKSQVLDPTENQNMYSSNKTSYSTGSLSTRDLYVTFFK